MRVRVDLKIISNTLLLVRKNRIGFFYFYELIARRRIFIYVWMKLKHRGPIGTFDVTN